MTDHGFMSTSCAIETPLQYMQSSGSNILWESDADGMTFNAKTVGQTVMEAYEEAEVSGSLCIRRRRERERREWEYVCPL